MCRGWSQHRPRVVGGWRLSRRWNSNLLAVSCGRHVNSCGCGSRGRSSCRIKVRCSTPRARLTVMCGRCRKLGCGSSLNIQNIILLLGGRRNSRGLAVGHGWLDVLHSRSGGRNGRGHLPGVGWVLGLMGYGWWRCQLQSKLAFAVSFPLHHFPSTGFDGAGFNVAVTV